MSALTTELRQFLAATSDSVVVHTVRRGPAILKASRLAGLGRRIVSYGQLSDDWLSQTAREWERYSRLAGPAKGIRVYSQDSLIVRTVTAEPSGEAVTLDIAAAWTLSPLHVAIGFSPEPDTANHHGAYSLRASERAISAVIDRPATALSVALCVVLGVALVAKFLSSGMSGDLAMGFIVLSAAAVLARILAALERPLANLIASHFGPMLEPPGNRDE